MAKILTPKKRLLTVLLALAGIAVMVAYVSCYGSCSYLAGDILGIDLKYLGILYMAAIIVLALMGQSLPCLLLLAFGVGGEIFLIGYQIKSGVYCPYCLVFSVTLLAALAINFDRRKKALAALAAFAGLVFFLLLFSGSATPAYAAETRTPSFGKGPTEVRLYTDYFCHHCRIEEPEVMALLSDLVVRNLVRVIFIDTPMTKESPLYVRYFLAALQARDDFRQAVAARAALFEAAEKKVAGKEALEAFLSRKGLVFKTFDPDPVFKIFTHYLKEDKINATPTCVIIGPKGKRTFLGSDDILKALRELLPGDPGRS